MRSSSTFDVVSIPPSPVESSLRGWNEKQAISPCGRPIFSHCPFHRISLPMAHAAAELYRLLVAQGRGAHEPSVLVELLAGKR